MNDFIEAAIILFIAFVLLPFATLLIATLLTKEYREDIYTVGDLLHEMKELNHRSFDGTFAVPLIGTFVSIVTIVVMIVAGIIKLVLMIPGVKKFIEFIYKIGNSMWNKFINIRFRKYNGN